MSEQWKDLIEVLEHLELAIEYVQLGKKAELSQADAERMEEILELAQQKASLNFWIVEIDHLLGHINGHLTLQQIEHYENIAPLLKEYLEMEPKPNEITLRKYLEIRTKQPEVTQALS